MESGTPNKLDAGDLGPYGVRKVSSTEDIGDYLDAHTSPGEAVISFSPLYIFLSHAYPFTAIAVAALPAALLAYERDRREERVRPWAPLLGLVCAWLQPWQGATLLVILLITEMFLWRVNRLPRLGLLAATAFATVAPLCYYAILSRLDASWTLAGEANRVRPLSLVDSGLVFGPTRHSRGLCLHAADPARSKASPYESGHQRRSRSISPSVLPMSAPFLCTLYKASASRSRYLPSPVRLLLLRTCAPRQRLPARLCLSLYSLPLHWSAKLDRARGLAKTDATKALVFGDAGPYVTASENDALDYLQSTSAVGGVLASRRIGPMVPAHSDRHTWVGLLSWTPNFERRARAADALLAGQLRTSDARSLVHTSGARFVLSDCRLRADLTTVLRPMLESVRHFGCATVYRVEVNGG